MGDGLDRTKRASLPSVDPLIANAFYNVNRRSLLTPPPKNCYS